MRLRVQRWGNSLALRIPKAFAVDAHLTENREVDVTLVEGSLVVRPVQDEAPPLETLLAGVTPENVHRETEWGRPRGREAW